MIFGVMKEASLSRAMDVFLLNCQAAGMRPVTRRIYHKVITAFIHFTGDVRVRELGPDHVRRYIADLADPLDLEKENRRVLTNHYTIIRTWIRWIFVQKQVTERTGNLVKHPRIRNLFPSQSTKGLAFCV